MMYEDETKDVEAAIAALKCEPDAELIPELENQQAAAGTGLEFYGITKSVFERFLKEKRLLPETQAALKKGTKAVTAIYTK